MGEVLKPYGSLDLLNYYSKIAPYLGKFLKGKEIATKTNIPPGFFLKRGSNLPALRINDLKIVNEKMLKLRARNSLKDVKSQLNGKQALAWEYFVPRKLIQMFYATNGEHPGKDIERIFIDIDKTGDVKAEIAQEVCRGLVKIIGGDKEFNKLVKFKVFVMWTGNSFHIYLLLKKKVSKNFYDKYLAYHKDNPMSSFIGRWASDVRTKTGIMVEGGHEKIMSRIVIDSSGTPSGKLARAPFSVHVDDKKLKVDGVAVPIGEKELEDRKLVSKLRKLSPEKVLKDLKKYSKLLR